MFRTTPCLKDVPPLACYNFDTCEWTLIFFDTNVTNKVNHQKTLYYATSSNLCFCTTWQIGQTRILHFHSNAVLAHCQNSTSRCLISSIFSSLLYDSLSLVINAFSFGLLEGMVQTKGSRERCSSWTVLHAQCTSALSSGFPPSQGNAEALDRLVLGKQSII